jgi:hypothetical protein
MSRYSYDELSHLYRDEKLSTLEIAKKFGVCSKTIQHAMKQLGISRRSYAEALKIAVETGRSKPCPPPGFTFMKGIKNPQWKGGKRLSHDGYIEILRSSAPKGASGTQKYIKEHRLVWEQTHNKPLSEGWVVHHINGIKTDNRPSNLIALPKASHDKLPLELRKKMEQKIRELEIENRQLRRTLEDSQLIFYTNEN